MSLVEGVAESVMPTNAQLVESVEFGDRLEEWPQSASLCRMWWGAGTRW